MMYETDGGWTVIGNVAVDTGRLTIADPCNFSKVTNAHGDEGHPGTIQALSRRFIRSDHEIDVGITFNTGFGDGCYEVMARYDKSSPDWGNRIAEIRIVFIPEDENDS